jgi:hypothetical protein
MRKKMKVTKASYLESQQKLVDFIDYFESYGYRPVDRKRAGRTLLAMRKSMRAAK